MSSKIRVSPFSYTSKQTHNQASTSLGLSFLRRKGIKSATDPVMLTGYKPWLKLA